MSKDGMGMKGGQVKRDDEFEDPMPFEGLQVNAVLHEAKAFNDREIDPLLCCRIMTKLLYLKCHGEEFTQKEVTNLFFSVTKLFQSDDVHLRRLIYLMIKELDVSSDESLIVVSCLSKDMTSSVDLYRANAIRVLAQIMDSSMLGQIDRFLKQAIADQNPFVVSSALVAGLKLFKVGPDVVKRWITEIQSGLHSKSKMAQAHALQLLYRVKQHDRLAISKVVTSMARNPPSGALARCVLIRYICGVIASQGPNKMDQELLKFLTECLHHESASVKSEAARSICRIPNVPTSSLQRAITVLQDFLSSPSPVQRFAACRTLSQIVVTYPQLVAPCSVDLEHLITDANRSVATLAITVLLKTGVEANVDRLMKSITGFMSEISDEFKIVLVSAIKTLSLKYPHKYQSLMSFLATALREEGGFEFKKAIVDALLQILGNIPDAKEEALDHFCEFIEDCEFPTLAVRILHLLGTEGPKASNPAKYIRFIFNRVILEVESVRAAAVAALASFGLAVPELTNHVIVLLGRALSDTDDEVRDRVIYFLSLLESTSSDGRGGGGGSEQKMLDATLECSERDLELSLQIYLKKPAKHPFSLQRHLVEAVEDEKTAGGGGTDDAFGDVTTAAGSAAAAAAAAAADESKPYVNEYLEILNSIPEFAALGALFHSVAPVQLTEDESEYQVNCVKHMYPRHVVFQFNITNNMEGQQMENVQVEMVCDDEEWEEELLVPEEKLVYEASGVSFVCVSRPEGSYNSGAISCELQFNVREVDDGDVADDTMEETYQLEDMEVVERDFMVHRDHIGLAEFRRQWETLGEGAEMVKKFALGLDDLQAAVNAVIKLLGMVACEESDMVPEDKRSHACALYGVFIGDTQVMCRCGFVMGKEKGVTLKIAVRSLDRRIAEALATCIR